MAKRDPTDTKNYSYQVHIGSKLDKLGNVAGKLNKEGHKDLDSAMKAADEAVKQGRAAEVRSASGAMVTKAPEHMKAGAEADRLTAAVQLNPAWAPQAAQAAQAAAAAHAAAGEHAKAEQYRQTAQEHAAKAIDGAGSGGGGGGGERQRDEHGRFA